MDIAIRTMSAGKKLRVWSFIVTLFGDLARGRHDALSGATLSQLTSRVGIKPASMRVALHRLRKDGWIDSRRNGRAVWYFLTEHGRAETLAFSQRIYSGAETSSDTRNEMWHIIVCDPNGKTLPRQVSVIPLPGHPGVFFGLGHAPNLPDTLSLNGQIGAVPSWLRHAFTGPELHQDYRAFEASLAEVMTLLPDKIDPLDRAVLRCLIVHSWRRLLLRHPDLPDGFFGPECRIGSCRISVTALLACLGPVTPDDLTHVT